MSDFPPEFHPLDRVDPDDVVGSFFGTPGVEAALRASRFDVQEEMETLIRHFRDPDPKISLRAHGRMRAVLKEVATASGLLAKHEFTQSDPESGRTVKVSATAARIANKMKGLDVKIPITETGRPDFAAQYLPASSGDEPGPDVPGGEPDGAGGGGQGRGADLLRPGPQGSRDGDGGLGSDRGARQEPDDS